MKLPFTVEQFLGVFKTYNESIFPLQMLFYLLAGAIVFLSVKTSVWSDKVINSILAFFWVWMGIAYHILFFSTINKAAYLFGILFIIQGLLFFYYGVLKQRIRYKVKQNKPGMMGTTLVIFALIIYPALGYLFGHVYPSTPVFGVPCPTTIFSFGILLWSDKKVPVIILIIPFSWSLVGFFAATVLGMREDFALVLAGLLATALLLFGKQGVQTAKG
ncbi:DUF6064 family protein [Flavisolibacter ginsengisoli]|jgi:hypothetical protein|uniref:Uncharacterized protein n=1 Tax=Flavisolibacter ginsengisoli DSM 18119 TaxID=1121884 RepID=A0A1M4SNS1_9BACT|nr:DUF6064 family protein [Flavisolibacter ginsengisoli]SHE33934.1 hypothetical protein SAMN02745131_00182 [Flavisolibacter ginsengisoli DSM 18119]